jgi:hypothetical protein
VPQDFRFFHELSFPQAPEHQIGPFQFFPKIRKDIHSKGVVVKFATGINNTCGTGGEFANLQKIS